MTNQPNAEDGNEWLDKLLCKLTTGYTRKELFEFSEDETGLDKFDIADELKSVDKTKQAILNYIQHSYIRSVK